MNAVVRDKKQIWIERFDAFLKLCLRLLARGLNEELARRDAERGHGNLRWITTDEAAVAEALANLIIPSDNDTPGIDDVGVLGPSTLESLDKLIVSSAERQSLYSRGLLSFDAWALRERQSKFAVMTPEDQIQLLKTSQHIYEEWTSSGPAIKKAWRRFKIITREKGIPFLAGQLYPQIRSDSFQVFYTSRVSWIWLEYDGPPMDEGYPRLAPRL
jgi:Gluconate 2-dehydrogenase subunit 3